MGAAEFKLKLKMIWQVLSSKSVFIFAQKDIGSVVDSSSFGHGSIQDMLLMSVGLEQQLTSFKNMIEEAAIETGELHALQQFKAALDTLEQK